MSGMNFSGRRNEVGLLPKAEEIWEAIMAESTQGTSAA